jgi:hypothetical protein
VGNDFAPRRPAAVSGRRPSGGATPSPASKGGDLADLDRLTTRRPDVRRASAEALALKLVDEHWRAIEALALALFDRGRLTGAEIWAALQGDT